jgi:hypothetical protein
MEPQYSVDAPMETVAGGGHDATRRSANVISTMPQEVSRMPLRANFSAEIALRVLESQGNDAWLSDREIANAVKHRRKICQDDVLSGAVSAKCRRATDALSHAVAEAIAKGRVSETATLGPSVSDRNPLR